MRNRIRLEQFGVRRDGERIAGESRLKIKLEALGLAPESPEFKLIKAFLFQTYPLSDVGHELKTKISGAVEGRDAEGLLRLVGSIPTVENPRLEVFAPLELTEEEKNRYLGFDLANLQVCKGCSKKCSFCAVSAGNKVEMMPFPMILQLAQWRRQIELKAVELYRDWLGYIDHKLNSGELNSCITPQIRRHLECPDERGKLSLEAGLLSMNRLTLSEDSGKMWEEDMYDAAPWERFHPIGRLGSEFLLFMNAVLQEYIKHPLAQLYSIIQPEPRGRFLRTFPLSLDSFRVQGRITNYYDSDPFDYMDSRFLHQDGSRADYGDAFLALSDSLSPIHITTTGWRKGDALRKRAGLKIAEAIALNPTLSGGIRLSVPQFHHMAERGRLEEYVNGVLETMEILGPYLDEIMLFYEEGNSEFEEKVVAAVRSKADEMGMGSRVKKMKISDFSSREEVLNNDTNPDDGDIAACMAGYHIWPDGTVARQIYEPHFEQMAIHGDENPGEIVGHVGKWRDTPKGSRPTPTGFRAKNGNGSTY